MAVSNKELFQKLEKLASFLDKDVDQIANLDELLDKVRDIQKLVGKIKMKID